VNKQSLALVMSVCERSGWVRDAAAGALVHTALDLKVLPDDLLDSVSEKDELELVLIWLEEIRKREAGGPGGAARHVRTH
jgi:hypothetical protein